MPRGVLAFEDDVFALENICELLRRWGYRAWGHGRFDAFRQDTSFGHDAQARASIALVISDLHLEDAIDGLHTIQLCRQWLDAPALPALLLTGDTAPQVATRAQALNVTLVRKPIRPAILRATIERCLAEGCDPRPAVR